MVVSALLDTHMCMSLGWLFTEDAAGEVFLSGRLASKLAGHREALQGSGAGLALALAWLWTWTEMFPLQTWFAAQTEPTYLCRATISCFSERSTKFRATRILLYLCVKMWLLGTDPDLGEDDTEAIQSCP